MNKPQAASAFLPECAVVRAGESFVGKQGFTYAAAISAESVGAKALTWQASLAAVEEVVQLPITSPSAQFATYLNPAGTPLTRPLPVGVTRVRIRMRRWHHFRQ